MHIWKCLWTKFAEQQAHLGERGAFCQNAYTVILIQKKAEKNAMRNLLLHVFMWLFIYSYTYKQIQNTPLHTSTAHLRFQRSASQYISSVMHVSVICICRMPCKVSLPILPLLEMLMPHLFGSVPLSRGPQHVGLTANTVVAPCPRPPSPSSPSSLWLALFRQGQLG